VDLDARLDRSRLHVRAQRAQLGDCLRRSHAVRVAADAKRQHALATLDAALAGHDDTPRTGVVAASDRPVP